jgi:hypothetical protein
MSGPDPELDPRAQTDDRLRELLVGLERVRHSAEAAQADVMVALRAEARRLDAAEFAATGMPSRSHEEFVPDEIGVSTSLSPKFKNISVPYGALVPAGLDGILGAGRHVACDASSSTAGTSRMSCTCLPWIAG